MPPPGPWSRRAGGLETVPRSLSSASPIRPRYSASSRRRTRWYVDLARAPHPLRGGRGTARLGVLLTGDVRHEVDRDGEDSGAEQIGQQGVSECGSPDTRAG